MAEKKPPNEEPDNVEDVATEAEDAKEAKATAEEKPKAKPKAKPRAKKADADEATEEKPKPKPRKKAAPKDAPAEEPAAEEAADDDEPPADDAAKPADDDAEPAEEAKPKRRRRGAAEVTAGEARKPAARRDQDGKVIVRAKARYVRCAPRKARLVVDHIRGKSVDEARAILIHTPRAASRDVLKLLDSAIANAENNHELVADELKIDQCFVDEGPTLKRFRPRALGRATRIRKRTSHMTILLTPKE
ncbi:MAG: large subunit ribosomal protein [Solirubrobacteraceae bacterium]|jgi:ribosomal protein L22|nr:large subunit ribosomal protein [Solirubrobacteraceae bacterium]